MMLNAMLKGWLQSFPGLTYDLVSKYLPDSSAVDKGHLIRTRQGAQSTRSMRLAVVDARENVDDMGDFPILSGTRFDTVITCHVHSFIY